jgi:hypothetical protein
VVEEVVVEGSRSSISSSICVVVVVVVEAVALPCHRVAWVAG